MRLSLCESRLLDSGVCQRRLPRMCPLARCSGRRGKRLTEYDSILESYRHAIIIVIVRSLFLEPELSIDVRAYIEVPKLGHRYKLAGIRESKQ